MNLDPNLNDSTLSGASRDYKAIASREPVYRQEAFQMRPGRLPVSLNANMRPRPNARSGSGSPVGIKTRERIPVLVRHSNQRPLEAGTGKGSSSWDVSDPAWYNHSMLPGMGETPAASPGALLGTAGFGIAAGIALFMFLNKR